ncbi:hypothetical protein Hanom_Chr09g00829871 [Helianthus anomalus]
MKTGWYHQPHQLYHSSLGRERNTLQKIELGKKLNYEDPYLSFPCQGTFTLCSCFV